MERGAMLNMQNLEKVHGDAEVPSALTFWSSMHLNNAHEEETLLIEWNVMVWARQHSAMSGHMHF